MAASLTSPLDPRRIEAEIARVRERESSPFGGGVKANLFNLVVVSLPGGRPNEALDALVGRRPARIIRLASAEAGPAIPAEASVSGRCFPGTHDRGVCLEEIDIAAAGDPLGSGAGAWAPLVARDIPTFLWIARSWTPGGNLCPRRLQPVPGLDAVAHADKLIVDTSPADDPAEVLAALHRLREATRDRLAIADLAWSRTLPLRAQAARTFDPPDARDALDELTAVRLEGVTRSEALLFFLWLASRLGWQAFTGRGGPSFADAAGRTVLTIHEHPAPLTRGARLSFTASGRSVGEDPRPWRIAPDGELLLAEVDSLKQDALLEDAICLADRSFPSLGTGARGRGP